MKENWEASLTTLCKHRHYRAEEVIFFQGERADCIYYLLKGEVQGIVILSDGRQQSVRTNWAGSFFAIPSFFKHALRHVTALAIKDSEVLIIDRSIYQQCCQQIPEFTELLLGSMADEIEFMFNRLAAVKLFGSDINIARFICRRVESGEVQHKSGSMVLSCTHDYIANTMGLSRLTVSNILHKFQTQGWLRLGYRQLEITNYPALKKLAYTI